MVLAGLVLYEELPVNSKLTKGSMFLRRRRIGKDDA